MKQSLRALSAAAAIACLPAVALAGGDHHKAQRAECRAARDAKFLPTYDVNRDGTIDRTERQALRQAKRQEALTRFDADRDGQLSETEWTRLRQAKLGQRFAALDKNRDGGISRTEAAGPCSRLVRRFDEVDTNRDGSINSSELAAARMFGKRGKGRFHDRGPAEDEGVAEE